MPDHRFHQAGCHGDDVDPSEMDPHQPSYFFRSNDPNDVGGIWRQNSRCHLDTDDR